MADILSSNNFDAISPFIIVQYFNLDLFQTTGIYTEWPQQAFCMNESMLVYSRHFCMFLIIIQMTDIL